jgi:hypothetical protein
VDQLINLAEKLIDLADKLIELTSHLTDLADQLTDLANQLIDLADLISKADKLLDFANHLIHVANQVIDPKTLDRRPCTGRSQEAAVIFLFGLEALLTRDSRVLSYAFSSSPKLQGGAVNRGLKRFFLLYRPSCLIEAYDSPEKYWLVWA